MSISIWRTFGEKKSKWRASEEQVKSKWRASEEQVKSKWRASEEQVKSKKKCQVHYSESELREIKGVMLRLKIITPLISHL